MDTQTWKELPQLPVEYAAPLSISGSLLALKGWEEDGISNALHLYQPDARKWVKVADMPTKGQTPTCIMITDNELLVAGGWHKSHLATMDIAQVL